MMGRNRNAGKPGAKNPGKTFKRIMAEIMGRYKPHCVAVVLCLIVSAVANVYGTMFMQRLIDDYITPMISRPDPDFGPMGRAVLGTTFIYKGETTMEFFNSAIEVLQTLVVALSAGLFLLD